MKISGKAPLMPPFVRDAFNTLAVIKRNISVSGKGVTMSAEDAELAREKLSILRAWMNGDFET